MSTHAVRAVRIDEIAPHPNADTLGITSIDGYTVIVRLADWHVGDVGVYIEPDYVVPDAPWAAMLKGHRRIRVKRLRGIYSQGLLLSLADVGITANEGDDVMERLGITRWEPGDAKGPCEDDAPAPSCAEGLVAYDLENWRKHRATIAPDEPVVCTEKIHGESARFVFDGDRVHAGSRTRWKRLDTNTSWTAALRDNPWIEAWCREHPGMILYGEVFGNVPTMAYGVRKGARGFLAFDVWSSGWLPWNEFANDVPSHHRVPVLYEGSHACVTDVLAEGVSTLAPHVREGFVVKSARSAADRIALKCVGNGYYERGD